MLATLLGTDLKTRVLEGHDATHTEQDLTWEFSVRELSGSAVI